MSYSELTYVRRRVTERTLLLFLLGALGTGCSEDESSPAREPSGTDKDGTEVSKPRDGSVRADASGTSRRDAGGGSSQGAGGGSGGGGSTCAKAELATTRVIPRVWMLVDGSGSMSSPLGGLAGASRWSLLRGALLAQPDGLIARLQSSVEFGLFVYDGGLSPPGVKSDLCPRVVEVPPSLDNLDALSMAYPAAPLGASTPTHYALVELEKRIAAAAQSGSSPTYVILATDGKPNLCDFHDGVPATVATDNQAVETVRALAAMGTNTYAISLAGGDPELEAHLQDIARAGNTGKPAFSPTSGDALVAALTDILGGTTSCDVVVQGSIVPGRECAGDVLLNDRALVCDGADGYRILDDKKTLQLTGAACDELRQKPASVLSAAFACDDVIAI